MRRAPILLFALAVACASTPQTNERPLFALQSSFWLNLHHVLRAAGRGMPMHASLTAGEQRAWDGAVAAYRERWSKRDLLFDDGMVAIKDALRAVPNDAAPPEFANEPELAGTLLAAAPVYRKHWWPAHDTLNRSWIASVEPLIARYGAALSRRVPAAYGERWPRVHPVDLANSAGPNGAYTTAAPHSTIASGDSGYLGPAALEMLFHEASHQWGRRLQVAISASAGKRGKKVPPQLWHAVLFYNTGELTRRVYAEDGYDQYVEYAAKGKVYDALCGAGCRERVAAAWNRHLDGGASIEDALDALVASWPDAP